VRKHRRVRRTTGAKHGRTQNRGRKSEEGTGARGAKRTGEKRPETQGRLKPTTDAEKKKKERDRSRTVEVREEKRGSEARECNGSAALLISGAPVVSGGGKG